MTQYTHAKQKKPRRAQGSIGVPSGCLTQNPLAFSQSKP